MVVLQVPGIVWAASAHGAVGAAAVWFGVNTLYLLLWTAVAHRRFAPGLHGRWVGRDLLPPLAAAAVAGALSTRLPGPDGRLAGAALLVASACGILLAAALAAPRVRADIRQTVRARA